VSISRHAFHAPSDDLKQLLAHRGPDHVGHARIEVRGKDGNRYRLSFTSTVLALRGGAVKAQPFQDGPSGGVLCWNGEAWAVDSNPIVGNDGQAVFDLLVAASASQLSIPESITAVLKVIQSISGPFAFVFFDRNHEQVYLGRDRLGRRSLLFNTLEDPQFMEFASCADPVCAGWQEVEADGIYQLSLSAAVLARPEQGTRGGLSNLLFASMAPCQRHAWEDQNSLPYVSLLPQTPVIH
jgi:asparagine synthetase B (glutamine-hydrolysing)